LKNMISQPRGDTAANYNNSNFTLCRILLPYMRYDDAWIEQQPGTLEHNTAILFRIQIRQLVLQPSGLTYWDLADFKDWTHENAAGYRAPRFYLLNDPDAPSIELGDYLERAGAGALVLSSYEMAQVLVSFEKGQLLPKSWTEQMKVYGCGFDGTGTVGEHGKYYAKNGGYSDDGRGGQTIIMIFPNKIMVSINSNSNRTKNDQFVASFSLLRDLFDDSWAEN
jgi:CubicO group peptidase (beta-lactamase class C family)